MKAPKKKPFTITRQPSRKVETCDSQKISAESQLSRALATIERRDPHVDLQNQILATQTQFKNCYNLFKVSPGLLPELLQRYADDNVKYRDEEFTQQADNFLTRIAASKKIPKELRAKYPLYYILVSLCKIFMLNEYEIIVLACALDHCSWKIEETVYPEEASFLREFPGNLGNDIDTDCKRLIIYLLVITFSLKQYINDKGEADKIHAYCESICHNFQAIFNRWTRVSYYHKFNYSALEINRKFRQLSQREVEEPQNGLKDYNIIVDSIMNLTGSYKSKIPPKGAQNMSQIQPTPTPLFASLQMTPMMTPMIDTKPMSLFPDSTLDGLTRLGLPSITYERSVSRSKGMEVSFDGFELPEIEPFSRQTSSSNLLGEDSLRKKQKLNNQQANTTSGFTGLNNLFRDNSLFKEFNNLFGNTSGNALKSNEIEDFLAMNGPLPALSKRSSTASQAIIEEQPSLFRFHSNMSSWQI